MRKTSSNSHVHPYLRKTFWVDNPLPETKPCLRPFNKKEVAYLRSL